jgi:hypothetical protein
MQMYRYRPNDRLRRGWCVTAFALMGLLITSSASAQVVISDFRVRGPAGA